MTGKYDKPKSEKISEKTMVMRVTTIVVVVALCLLGMGIGAYACFSSNATSSISTIRSASFRVSVTVQIKDENGQIVPVHPDSPESRHVQLEGGETYYITLQHDPSSTAETGFVIIAADRCGEQYHTQQLGRDGEGNTKTVTFRLQPSETTVVTFRDHWGTSSYYGDYQNKGIKESLYITNGEEIELAV